MHPWLPVALLAATAAVNAPAPPPAAVPIAYVNERSADGHTTHEGEDVIVTGVANVGSDTFYTEVVKFFIEDDHSGVAVFSRGPQPLVKVGDIVRVRGTVTTYAGVVEVVPGRIEVLGRAGPPQPQRVRPSDLASYRHSGRLVQSEARVVDVTTRGRGTDTRLLAGREIVTLHITQKQQHGFPALEAGMAVTVNGIASSYILAGQTRVTWQILPRSTSDVVIIQKPPLFTRDDAARAAAAAAAIVLLIVVWNLSLRRRVRLETEGHRASETRFRVVADTAPSAIFIYQGTRFRYVNRATEEITGYSAAELVGLDFISIIDPAFRDLVRGRALARQRGEHVPPRYEARIVRKDGTKAWLDLTAGLIDFEGLPAALGTAFDITERKRAEEALQKSEERFRALIENASDALALLDPNGTVLWAGPSTRRVLGYEDHELVGRNGFELIHPDDQPHLRHLFAELLRAPRGDTRTFEYRARSKDGQWHWLEATASNLVDEPFIGGIVANYRDVSERKRTEEEIRYQALHDVLTGLPNRSLFQDRLELALAHARRSGKPLAVMFVDLDLFKLINDNLGHTVGDRMLQEVSARLRQCLRASDTVARVGGDEFTVVLEDLEAGESAPSVAEKILDELDKPFDIDGHRLHVTASIGVSLYPGDGDDADTLTRNADKAMYRAKELGRNTLQLFTPEMNERYRNRLAFEAGFRKALEREEFVVHFQPFVGASDERPVGVEALVRWNDPERGLVYPDDFIHAAEETRMIIPLGSWVLRTACAQVQQWREARLPPMQVSVNLSVRQFQQRDLIAMIDSVLEDTALDPSLLELEITESVAMQNVELTRAVLQQLRARRVRIAIDDFGAGQSSLIYLRQFPLNTIKIDRVFIRDVTANPGDAAIVSAIIRLAHDLGLVVVAEGVETSEQKEFLSSLGCDLLQGYYFSRPLPAEEVRARLMT
jgi:diguanylate cyclase (GGDEF)-like protein/PAS domain S-box-containing protein